MTSISLPEPLSLSLLRNTAFHHHHHLPCLLFLSRATSTISSTSSSRSFLSSRRLLGSRRHLAVAATATLMANSVPPKDGVYIVGDFMTRKEELHVVKPTTTVDEALDLLVENRITGFPVIDDDWKLLAGEEQNPVGMMGIQLSVDCS